ncbi:MAG: serine hydrolase [Prevotella sp.]|nr:serine hydrolase [Prevotella sp.]
MKAKSILLVLMGLLCIVMTSCSIIRGYRADGAAGPHIFSFEHHVHDTIPNGSNTFSFPVAKNRADWIDTLHFFTQGPQVNNLTFPDAMGRKGKTQGVMIIQNDSIIYEKYWGDMTADRLATVFSVSKSINSLLCGIAVDDGYIHSIDDAVTEYLPELKKKDPMWQKLTIRHLLDMRSGLDFDDTYYLNLKGLKRLHAMARLNYGHNLMKQIRGLKFRCEPGTDHRYESMTAQILGVVIERASGKHYVDYLSEKVWKPLQMESPALINIDSRKHDVAHAFGGITLTLKDLAKIGRLYLNRGMWNGKRIVSEEWIRQSTEYNTSNKGYHFNWYNLSSVNHPKEQYPGYYAEGIKGQVLYVNPYKNLIMVRIGLNNNFGAVFIPELFEVFSNCDKF